MQITPNEIEAFLDEALPPARMAEIERLLRDDAAAKALLADVVGRRDAGVHTVGAIWRRRRLSCPSREQLGSHLLGVLGPDETDYLQFHLTVVGCRWCEANLEDLRQLSSSADQQQVETRRRRYFQSSIGGLPATDT
jgi:hypothetical protein